MTASSRTRKRHPLALTALVLLFLSAAYIGAYWLNATGKRIVYFTPTPITSSYAPNRDPVREVPEYFAFQRASEIVFWPVAMFHGRIDPDRFDNDESDRGQWPAFREDWW